MERKEIKLLLGSDWLRELDCMMQDIETATKATTQSEKKKVLSELAGLLETNRTQKRYRNEFSREARTPTSERKNYTDKVPLTETRSKWVLKKSTPDT